MKRSELKKLIKPLVKECIHETLLEGGLLSNIVSEVVKGLGNQMIVENKQEVVPSFSNENSVRSDAMKTKRKKLLDSIGRDTFNGVDLFEGTNPIRDSGTPSAQANPLSGQDPNDAGVDISGILALGGRNWKTLVG